MKFSKRNRVNDADQNVDDDQIVQAASSQEDQGEPNIYQGNSYRGLIEAARRNKWLVFMVLLMVAGFFATGLGIMIYFRLDKVGQPSDLKGNYSDEFSTLPGIIPENAQTSPPDSPCSVAARTDCSPDKSTSEEKCKANGCCWKPADDSTPWCFYPSYPSDPNCRIPDSSRLDCHPDKGANADKCKARDCCWFPASTTDNTIPHCFYPADAKCSVLESNRVDCHPDSGSIAETCRARGCCWVPVNNTGRVKDIPYCFYQADDKKCSVPDTTRLNCHPDNGPNPDKCVARGCCWVTTTATGVPSCFYPADVKCKVSDSDRVDCYTGSDADPDKCRARGCCWVPASITGKNYPYCFYPADVKCNVSDSDRVDCHSESGATPEKCRAKNCCWVPASDSAAGFPYCFNPSK